jgi:hypothetical protein
MNKASSPVAESANRAFASRQREFLQSLAEIFADEFRDHWIPVFAETFYRVTRKASEEKKIEDMRQMLAALSGWLAELRIRLLHDLARFSQMNQDALCGGVKTWLKRSCDELWNSVVTEEDYREWFAIASDDTSNLEIWRAPLWLARALKTPEKEIRLEERPYQEEGGYIICNSAETLADFERLDDEHTDKLIHQVFFLEKLSLILSVKESQEIVQLHLFISQGAKIPAGLHDNDEESSAQIFSRHLAFFSGGFRRTKGKHRKKTRRLTKREVGIRSIINTGLKGLSYCKELDDYGVKIPEKWLIRGCPLTYEAAYKEGAPWRHSILTEKWQVKKLIAKNQKNQTI